MNKKSILVLSYYSNVDDSCQAEWVDDRINPFIKKGYNIILISSILAKKSLNPNIKHFRIPSINGRNQPEIDCMFFPCTIDDDIKVFKQADRNESINTMDDEGINRCKYLDKPTIIMCNPNALIY